MLSEFFSTGFNSETVSTIMFVYSEYITTVHILASSPEKMHVQRTSFMWFIFNLQTKIMYFFTSEERIFRYDKTHKRKIAYLGDCSLHGHECPSRTFTRLRKLPHMAHSHLDPARNVSISLLPTRNIFPIFSTHGEQLFSSENDNHYCTTHYRFQSVTTITLSSNRVKLTGWGNESWIASFRPAAAMIKGP